MMRNRLIAGLLFTMALVGWLPVAGAQNVSELWGQAGENWSPESRLPDVSFAGYRFGEEPIPDVPVVANVKNFGATGDGQTDDSDAFLKAIEETASGAILIPNGTYLITKILEITKPGLVIRGESRDETVLFFPKPLQEIRPNWGATTTGQKTSNYSWSGGFIQVKGSYRTERITALAGEVKRGSFFIPVESTEGLLEGQRVDIHQQDDEDNTLARHMYTGDSGGVDKINGRTRTSMTAEIVAVESDGIRIDRPLRFDAHPRWNAGVSSFEPTVTEVGIENLTFRFPVTPYGGHFSEMGFNPIAMSRAAHCWARNLRIQHADSGFFISSRFCTIENVLFESDREPDARGETGHHGITLSGDDNRFSGFEYRTSFIHDITVTHSAGNVISNGRGVNLSFDHHKRVPYANVFTNIHVGLGEDVWRCGGGADLGKHCAAWGTFWNIRADNPISYPPERFGAWSINVVGITTEDDGVTDRDGRWYETIAPEVLVPQNIHEAQLQRRLSASGG